MTPRVGLVRDDNFDRATDGITSALSLAATMSSERIGRNQKVAYSRHSVSGGSQGLCSSSKRADVLRERFGQPEGKTGQHVPSVVKLDYGKVSASDISSFNIVV